MPLVRSKKSRQKPRQQRLDQQRSAPKTSCPLKCKIECGATPRAQLRPVGFRLHSRHFAREVCIANPLVGVLLNAIGPARKHPTTLFIIFVDECHTSFESGSVASKFLSKLNELQKLNGNIVEIFISATGWNNISKTSRIPARFRVERNSVAVAGAHTLQEGATVFVSNIGKSEWRGFLEDNLHLESQPVEKRINPACLSGDELNIVSWFPRAIVSPEIIGEYFEGKFSGLSDPEQVTVLRREENGWIVSFRGVTCRKPLLPHQVTLRGIQPPISAPTDVVYWSLDRYMSIVTQLLNRPAQSPIASSSTNSLLRLPPRRSPFVVDLGFEMFCAVWRSKVIKDTAATQEEKGSEWSDAMLLADYELSILFVKTFLCDSNSDADLPTRFKQSAFYVTPQGTLRDGFDIENPKFVEERTISFWRLLASTVASHLQRYKTKKNKDFHAVDSKLCSVLYARLVCMARYDLDSTASATQLHNELSSDKFFKDAEAFVRDNSQPTPLFCKFVRNKLRTISALARERALGMGLNFEAQEHGRHKTLSAHRLWTFADDCTLWSLRSRVWLRLLNFSFPISNRVATGAPGTFKSTGE